MADWMVRLIEQTGYFGIAVLMFLENVIPPIPSEVIMGIGGIKAGQGSMAMIPLVAAGTVGTVAGNYVWFMIGRKLGVDRLRPFLDRWGRWLTLDWEEVQRMSHAFHKHGASIVFIARFIPTFRTLISLPAGMFGMGRVKFLLWTTGGATIWNTGLALAGFYLGRRFTRIDEFVGPISTGVVVLIVGIYLWRVIFWRPAEVGDEG